MIVDAVFSFEYVVDSLQLSLFLRVEFLIGQVEWYKIKERSSWFLDALCVDWAERLSAQQNSRREEDDHLESVKEPRDGLIRITTG